MRKIEQKITRLGKILHVAPKSEGKNFAGEGA